MKRYLLLTILAMGVFLVRGQERHTSTSVEDYANIYTDEQERAINGLTSKFWDTAQIVIITVPSIGDQDIASYTTHLFNQWGLGDKQRDNGLLIVHAIKERKLFTATGRGIEAYLPDITVGHLQDQKAIPYFKKREFYQGVYNLVQAYIREVSLGVRGDALQSRSSREQKETEDMGFWVMLCFFIAVAILLGVLFWIMQQRYSRKKQEAEEMQAQQEQAEEDHEQWLQERKRETYDRVLSQPFYEGSVPYTPPAPKPAPKKEKNDDDHPSYYLGGYSSGSSDSGSSSSSSQDSSSWSSPSWGSDSSSSDSSSGGGFDFSSGGGDSGGGGASSDY